jgi:KaiC/GvpD/RAD55 family RecA-like ATPase
MNATATKTNDITNDTSAYWPEDLVDEITSSKPSETTERAWGRALPVLRTAADLLKSPLPPAVPLIGPWLDKGQSCLLWGGTGTGKSLLALTLALGMAGGGRILGWDFPTPCKVLYFDGEMSLRDTQERMRRLVGFIEGIDVEAVGRNLIHASKTEADPEGRFFDLSTKEQIQGLLDLCSKVGASVVVWDNLSVLSDGLEDENDATCFKSVQAVFNALKGAGITGILVHHAGKSGQSYRGSSNLATTFERIVSIKKDAEVSATDVDITITVEKVRNRMPAGFEPSFKAKLTDNGWESDEGFAAKSWRLFASRRFSTKGAFVKGFNETYRTSYNPAHFATQFAERWVRDFGKTDEEMKRILREARERAKVDEDDEKLTSGPEF